MSLTIWDKHKT